MAVEIKCRQLGVGDLNRLLESGEASAVALTEHALASCEALADSVNAFAHLDYDGALAAARASDVRRAQGERVGPLDGIPVTVKDNLFVRGLPAEWGSKLYRNHVPAFDDIPIERLRAAGTVIIGKTTTPEFSLGGRTSNLIQGTTRNPLDLRLTPGGSSGGAAASVAAGLVPIAIGTDAGGSIRMPASYTNLFGLRPSNGRVPRLRGFPPLALDYQVIGLLAHRLHDLRLLLTVLQAPDPRDPLSFSRPDPAPVRRKIGWFNTVPGELVDPQVAARTEAAAECLRYAGWTVMERELPCGLDLIRSTWTTLTAVSVSRVVARYDGPWEALVSDSMRSLAERGMRITTHQYAQALDDLTTIRQSISEKWGNIDVFLTPTAASPAWPVEYAYPPEIAGKPGHAAAQSIFANWVNAAGLPAINVPAEPHTDGRAIGVQVVGRFGQDETVLSVAETISTFFAHERETAGLL